MSWIHRRSGASLEVLNNELRNTGVIYIGRSTGIEDFFGRTVRLRASLTYPAWRRGSNPSRRCRDSQGCDFGSTS